LEPHIAGQAPLLPFTLAVIASAWYGGLIAGLSYNSEFSDCRLFLYRSPIPGSSALGGACCAFSLVPGGRPVNQHSEGRARSKHDGS
jgi:hypothetical protein